MTLYHIHSSSYEATFPKLSVLVPFYADDATDLLSALDAQMTDLSIEVLFYDDGTGDAALTDRMSKATSAAKGAISLITNSENKGCRRYILWRL